MEREHRAHSKPNTNILQPNAMYTDHISDPFVSLSLRVNEQRPSSGELHDDPVLYRQVVLGQAGNLPVAHLHWVAHRVHEVRVVGVGDIVLV